MNETTLYEGTTHEPATGPTSTSLETAHETIPQEISTHETPELDIRPEKMSLEIPDWRRKTVKIPTQTESHTRSREGERAHRSQS